TSASSGSLPRPRAMRSSSCPRCSLSASTTISGNIPAPALGLGFLEPDATRLGLLQGFADVHHLGVEIDIAPAERQQLATADPSEQSDHESWDKSPCPLAWLAARPAAPRVRSRSRRYRPWVASHRLRRSLLRDHIGRLPEEPWKESGEHGLRSWR